MFLAVLIPSTGELDQEELISDIFKIQEEKAGVKTFSSNKSKTQLGVVGAVQRKKTYKQPATEKDVKTMTKKYST